MKLALFGATGATGQCLVEQALDQGYTVTAFARNPLALPTGHARLSIATGDVFQKAPVEEAVANQDAVSARSAGMIDCEWLFQGILASLGSVRLGPGISLMP